MGNVDEWVLDEFILYYEGAPVDGSAYCSQADCSGDDNRRVHRGYCQVDPDYNLYSFLRRYSRPSEQDFSKGGRLSRSTPP